MIREFTHGGAAGDVIYHLATVRDGGGGRFWLNGCRARDWHGGEQAGIRQMEALLPLIRFQPYITETGVVWEVRGTDLDGWRVRHVIHGLNLSDQMSEFLGLPHTPRAEPWLAVPDVKREARVVVHRSPRYRNPSFRWDLVHSRYAGDAVFVGHEEEHAEYSSAYGRIPYLPTTDYLELARVIAGATLFVGNQSSPAAVAQGLRKPMLQETVPPHHPAWNCHWIRPQMWHDTVYLPSLDELEGRRNTYPVSGIRPGGGGKSGTFTLVSNWDKAYSAVGEFTYPARERYAERHGYECRRSDHPGHWGKVKALLDAWGGSDWLWWLDSDAAITNPEISLTSLVDRTAEVVITCDVTGLNSGSMLLKTTPRIRGVLEAMERRRPAYDRAPYHDQNGFAHLLWTIKDVVKIVPQRAMNSYPDSGRGIESEVWQPGDFVLHCPAMTNEQRLAYLGSTGADSHGSGRRGERSQ